MTKKEMVMDVIREMGYRAEVDNDGDVFFCYQMKHIFVVVGDEDDPYLIVLLPKILEVEDGDEAMVLTVCNKMTRELKLCKVYMDESFKFVHAVCEFYYTDRETLKQFMMNSIDILSIVRSAFRTAKDELFAEQTG